MSETEKPYGATSNININNNNCITASNTTNTNNNTAEQLPLLDNKRSNNNNKFDDQKINENNNNCVNDDNIVLSTTLKSEIANHTSAIPQTNLKVIGGNSALSASSTSLSRIAVPISGGVKQSGIKTPSRIGRPCCTGLQKPAVPPTPTKSKFIFE